jgi:hypothetical protein
MSDFVDPIPGQQVIPVPVSPPEEETCAWCGERATHTLELEPAQYTWRKKSDGKRVKLTKRRALEVPTCRRHYQTLERSKAA